MIHRKVKPDTRPDWRDPNMWVTREYKLKDGTVTSRVSSADETKIREHFLHLNSAPHWSKDPTYNLGRKK